MDIESGIRLEEFLTKSGIKQRRVASVLGVMPQYINSICKGRKGISKKMANTLQEHFGVSAAWLLTGQGNMLIESEQNEEPAPVISYEHGRPYFNVDFAAGFDTFVPDTTTTPDYLIDFPPYNSCDCWVSAHGNSMAPTIASGDIIAMKRVEDYTYLINGEIYAIVTSNGLRTIKRIQDNGDTLTLIPDNTTIPTQTIPKDIVTHVWHIVGCVRHF